MPISILRYNHQTRDYRFVRDEHPSIQSLLQQDYSKVYFLKNFPGVDDGHTFEDMLRDTFFIRPSSTSKVSDNSSIIEAMKNDLSVTHIFGVYHLTQSKRKASDSN